MLKQISRLVLFIFWLSLVSYTANAQGAARAVLYNTKTDSFPLISAYLNAFDAEGNFVHGLGVQDVRIIEDQQSLPIQKITELTPGAQYAVAINMGPAYAIQDVNAISRYEHIQEALQIWAQNYPEGSRDNLSLITNEELEGLHFENPADWLSLFESYQPNFDTTVPSLDVLSQAITIAGNLTADPGNGRGILFITPLPGLDNLAALPSLESLAKQSQIRVDVWMISSRAYFDGPEADQLAEFARQTGGQFFAYSGEEPLPLVDRYVNQLRYTYSLTYNSKISSGDIHQIAATVNTNGLSATSDIREFSLSVQPPNPILVSPPIEIIRNEQVSIDEDSDSPTYNPVFQHVEILTEFPDEFQRSLENSKLIVDGVVVDENLAPPFNIFNWDLSNIIQDGTHLIQVEVVDNLGLRGSTIQHQVTISIQEAPFNPINAIRQNLPSVIGISSTLIFVLLIFILIIRGKIQPKSTGRLTGSERVRENGIDPDETLPTPKPGGQSDRITRERISQWMTRLSLPKRQHSEISVVEAFLEFSYKNNGDTVVNNVPISQRVLTIGSDSTICTIDIDDPTIEPLHARIIQDENGMFKISDENSITGTWVNYSPISSETTMLKHGDIIHTGRINFRFKYADAKMIPKPKVSPQEPM